MAKEKKGDDGPPREQLVDVIGKQQAVLSEINADLDFHQRMAVLRMIAIGGIFILPILAHTDASLATPGALAVELTALALLHCIGTLMEKAGIRTHISHHPRGWVGAIGDFGLDAGFVVGAEAMVSSGFNSSPITTLMALSLGVKWGADMIAGLTRS